MSTPTILFELNKELDEKVCLEFLNIKVAGINFGQGIIQTHPKLKKALVDDVEEQEKTIALYINHYYRTHQEKMKGVLLQTHSSWGKIALDFYQKVEFIFENRPWPKGPYFGYLSIFDINPRFLETKSFQVFYLKKENEILQTIAHEMLHFMFYDCLERFNRIKRYPDETIWQLSELFNTLILSQDEFKKLGIGSDLCYPELSKYLPQIKNYWLKRKNLNSFIQESLKYLKMVTVSH